MSMTFIGLLGYIGLAFLVLAYFLLLVGQLKVIDMHYIMLNLIGAFMIVISLLGGGTLPLTQLIMMWFFISLYGFYKHHVTTTT